MKPITGPEMCRLIENDGWRLRRISGSHHIYSKPGEQKVISVPVHGSKPLKSGLAAKIAKDTGIHL